MGKGRGNAPSFARFMNKDRGVKNSKGPQAESGSTRVDDSAKGQSMKNSNASHRTCQ